MRMPALFVGHGAAILTTSPVDPLNRFLSTYAAEVSSWKPRGVVVVSAHHVGRPVQLTGAGALETIHDHPAPHLFGFSYAASGSDTLVSKTGDALRGAGIPFVFARDRGLDHGSWVPLSLLLPKADVPVVALSLDASEEPAAHVALGRALRPLRDEGILVLGSGGTTHDQSTFRRGWFAKRDVSLVEPFSRRFDAWVTEGVTTQTAELRTSGLASFRQHPDAAQAHPTVEHFLPMLVVAGASGDDAGTKPFEGFQHSLSTSVFRFG